MCIMQNFIKIRTRLVLTTTHYLHFSLTYFTKFQNGSFGGTYFRPIYSSVTKTQYGPEVWEELPQDWLEGLDIQTQVL